MKKEATLTLIVNMRTEDCYRVVIAQLLKMKPSLVIEVNPPRNRVADNCVDLRESGGLLRQLIADGKQHSLVNDAVLCGLEAFISGQATLEEIRESSNTMKQLAADILEQAGIKV